MIRQTRKKVSCSHIDVGGMEGHLVQASCIKQLPPGSQGHQAHHYQLVDSINLIAALLFDRRSNRRRPTNDKALANGT